MKEEWLFFGAMVPVDVETTAALVAEIKRLIDVVGGMALAQPAQEPVAYTTPQPKAQTACCAECGKKESDGWFLYCVDCMEKTNV
jgi:hypothetical protein